MLLLPKVLKTEMGKSITEATIGVRWRRCAEASCQIWGPINPGRDWPYSCKFQSYSVRRIVFQRTDTAVSYEPLSLVMETQRAPRVTCVDRFRSGVVVTFENGKCALYSPDLLHGTFPQAEELKETDSAEPISSDSN
jgi:hypothetical protein